MPKRLGKNRRRGRRGPIVFSFVEHPDSTGGIEAGDLIESWCDPDIGLRLRAPDFGHSPYMMTRVIVRVMYGTWKAKVRRNYQVSMESIFFFWGGGGFAVFCCCLLLSQEVW